MAPTMLEELCKRIQHCCATLHQLRNKRNVGSCWLKSLTSFKLCATTSNNIQQGEQTDATCNIQQCCVRMHGALVLPPQSSLFEPRLVGLFGFGEATSRRRTPKLRCNLRIIEFASYFNGFFGSEVNTQGKTFSELTRSQETLDKMKEKKTKTIYWIKENAHYMAYADSCLGRIPMESFDFIPNWGCQSGALSSRILTLFVILLRSLKVKSIMIHK